MTSGEEPMEKLIVAQRSDRLGGRLNTLVNALRLADKTGFAFRFHWGTIKDRDYEVNNYRELFTEEFLRNNLDNEQFRDLKPRLFRLPQRPAFPLDELAARCDGRAGCWVNDVRIYVFPGETPEQVRQELRGCFQRLGFHPELQRAFEEIARSMAGEEAVALHIRRGDVLWPMFRWFSTTSKHRPTLFYTEYLRRRLAAGAQERFLVFSDDPETTRDLKRDFPGLRSSEDFFDPSRYTDLQLAVLDMVLMMQCREIVGPGGSAYSNFAEALAGTKLLPVTALFEEGELQALLRRSLDERLPALHRATERERVDFVMDVLTLLRREAPSADLIAWLPLVLAARACDPDNYALEHALARIEWARGNKCESVYHYMKIAASADFVPQHAQVQQKYALDAAVAAAELFASDLVPNFPLHAKRPALLQDAASVLEAAAAREPSGGRMEAALVEVWAAQGRLPRIAELLSASAGLSAPEDREGFRYLFGRLLLGGESLRHQARQQLKVAARQEETADLAAALLYRLHRQDRDETGMRRMLRRRPSAREAYPWLFADLDEAESDESSIPGGFNEEEAARESAAEE